MVIANEPLQKIKYVTDESGERTDVVISLPLWKTFLTTWQQMIEKLEDQEDFAILYQWLQKRFSNELKMIPLNELEKELIADGLLPS